eukprot:CAMPEP_0177360714 /NCGR_PEP_ID=MMETSP0368-20130122/36800_1 /TAXON_ID=447022 ORGANISM="Scrippsiella hangoei-like, Strain SHHI-4" /NCGR_SAMPLE_ID=MMETSP0368 /ASSEMBLY_ACC=CAM_ASM_000363 /LENGTH=149 /DNA_ID=CAMNT_0018823319 /DNA_START=53 /DNA_END=500 /DNA_ORIENTATION=+
MSTPIQLKRSTQEQLHDGPCHAPLPASQWPRLPFFAFDMELFQGTNVGDWLLLFAASSDRWKTHLPSASWASHTRCFRTSSGASIATTRAPAGAASPRRTKGSPRNEKFSTTPQTPSTPPEVPRHGAAAPSAAAPSPVRRSSSGGAAEA